MESVSAVVCTYNSAKSIRNCLTSLRENGVREIIVVDASSDDGTREIAKELADKVLTDPRIGLAEARNIGIKECTLKNVINVGADNIMPPESIRIMLDTKLKMKWAGVSAVTIMQDPKVNYISWAMNLYKRARFYPGERNVIGTPSLFDVELLKCKPYDPKMSWSDDGELCNRLGKEGHKFGIADVEVFEFGSESFYSVNYRWKGYGKSDWETYNKFSTDWGIKRKIYSILYPLKNELILPLFRINGFAKIGALPFLIVITYIRYKSWFCYAISSKRELYE